MAGLLNNVLANLEQQNQLSHKHDSRNFLIYDNKQQEQIAVARKTIYLAKLRNELKSTLESYLHESGKDNSNYKAKRLYFNLDYRAPIDKDSTMIVSYPAALEIIIQPNQPIKIHIYDPDKSRAWHSYQLVAQTVKEVFNLKDDGYKLEMSQLGHHVHYFDRASKDKQSSKHVTKDEWIQIYISELIANNRKALFVASEQSAATFLVNSLYLAPVAKKSTGHADNKKSEQKSTTQTPRTAGQQLAKRKDSTSTTFQSLTNTGWNPSRILPQPHPRQANEKPKEKPKPQAKVTNKQEQAPVKPKVIPPDQVFAYRRQLIWRGIKEAVLSLLPKFATEEQAQPQTSEEKELAKPVTNVSIPHKPLPQPPVFDSSLRINQATSHTPRFKQSSTQYEKVHSARWNAGKIIFGFALFTFGILLKPTGLLSGGAGTAVGAVVSFKGFCFMAWGVKGLINTCAIGKQSTKPQKFELGEAINDDPQTYQTAPGNTFTLPYDPSYTSFTVRKAMTRARNYGTMDSQPTQVGRENNDNAASGVNERKNTYTI